MTACPSVYRGASTACLELPPAWIEDVGTWLTHSWDWFDPSHAHRLFWPDRPYQPGMEILVAGCGPSQAAVIAYTNPRARVTAIDIDEAALSHEVYLRHKHMLLNLEVRQLPPLPIEEVGSLDREFDLIIASGVLEHLDSPETGLKTLANALRPEGVVAIATSGLTVNSCLNLVGGAGLVFQDWVVKAPHYPHTTSGRDDEFLPVINGLSEREIWSAMEALQGPADNQLFAACRPERASATYRIEFSPAAASDYVPMWRLHAGLNGETATLLGHAMQLEPSKATLAREINGECSIIQIADQADRPVVETIALIEQLWRADLISIGTSGLS